MIGVALVNMTAGPVASLPPPVRLLAYGVVGWMLGQDISRESLSIMSRAAGPIAFVVVLIVGTGGVLAWILYRWAGLDPTTAYLATSPGGISQMAILATDTGARGSLVAVVHLARVVTVVLITPFVASWLPAGE